MPKLLFSSWVSWGILACQTVMWCLLVLFVVWLFLVLDWASFGRVFLKMNVWYWVLALVAKGSALGFRGVRCACLLPESQTLSTSDCIRYGVLGQFGNIIFPAKLGEGLRFFLLQRKSLWGWKRVVFALLADRLFDLWCILAALSFFLFLPPFSESSLKYLAYPCLLFFVGASLLYFGLPLIFGKKWGGESWKILCAWRFSTPTLVALSLWIWTLEALGLWCFLGALGLGSWYQAFSITFFYHLVIALPNTPGNIGVLELFYVYAFGLFQIPPEQALALSLVVQFSLFLLYVTLGMLVLFYEGWNFSDIKKLGKAGREQIQLDNYFSTC